MAIAVVLLLFQFPIFAPEQVEAETRTDHETEQQPDHGRGDDDHRGGWVQVEQVVHC